MDDPADVSSENDTSRYLLDGAEPARNRKVEGSNPSSQVRISASVASASR